MSALFVAFILIFFAFASQAISHALRQINESKKSKTISVIWHMLGSVFLFLIIEGVSQLNYDYFVIYRSSYETAWDKIYSIMYNVGYVMIIRFIVFNPVYNVTAGNDLMYAGKSNLFDNFENWIKKNTLNYIPTMVRMGLFVWIFAWSFSY